MRLCIYRQPDRYIYILSVFSPPSVLTALFCPLFRINRAVQILCLLGKLPVLIIVVSLLYMVEIKAFHPFWQTLSQPLLKRGQFNQREAET